MIKIAFDPSFVFTSTGLGFTGAATICGNRVKPMVGIYIIPLSRGDPDMVLLRIRDRRQLAACRVNMVAQTGKLLGERRWHFHFFQSIFNFFDMTL